MPAISSSTPIPSAAEPKKTGWTGRSPRLDGERLAQARVRQAGLVADVRAQDRLVVLGQDLGERHPMFRIGGGQRCDRRRSTARVVDGLHRDDRRRQPPCHDLDDAQRIGAGPVDLVDEDQRRDVESLERPEQERRLRLDALDRGDDEDRAIEHAEDAFDLGDEVRMARRVDQVDRQVAHEERGDSGPDRDAAFALELERVGLGGAGVDAADVIDGACGVEQTLAESGLTGVDVSEDPEIESAHGTSCLPRRWTPSGWS